MITLPTIEGGFRLIMADPPWRMQMWSEKGMNRCPDGVLNNSKRYYRNHQRQNSPERHYKTMSIDEIKALPVDDIAAKDCVLLLWAIDPLLPEAIEVGRAWGFTYKTVGFVWAKERKRTSKRGDSFHAPNDKRFPMGTGYWTRANPELCLLFTRGKPKRLSASVRKLLIAARREHSRKPDEIYPLVEALVDGPRLEMFGRSERQRWTVWGNEVGRFDAVAPLFDSGGAGAAFSHDSAPAQPTGGETRRTDQQPRSTSMRRKRQPAEQALPGLDDIRGRED